MSTDNLDALTDAQLSEVFAVEVAGWLRATPQQAAIYGRLAGKVNWIDSAGKPHTYPIFATSADAVIPLLPGGSEANKIDGPYDVETRWQIVIKRSAYASAPTFARAACLVIIKFNRAKKGTP